MTTQHTCWDFGGTCQEVIYGDTAQEATEAMMNHLDEAHPEETKRMTSGDVAKIKGHINDAFATDEEEAA